MITIKQWMEAINYRVTGGSEFYPVQGNTKEAYCLDSWDGQQDGVCCSIVFYPNTQQVLLVLVHDIKRDRAYRLANRDVFSIHDLAADNKAWDDVNYVDLETDGDMLSKLTAIMNYQPYDDRVEVELNLSDEEVFILMQMAHDNDITFNQLVSQILESELSRIAEEHDKCVTHPLSSRCCEMGTKCCEVKHGQEG